MHPILKDVVIVLPILKAIVIVLLIFKAVVVALPILKVSACEILDLRFFYINESYLGR